MKYKSELQLVFSGKEIALQRIKLIESTVFDDETEERFSRRRHAKYKNLLKQSNERIAEIKSRIAEDISAKKLQLEDYKKEVTQVNTRYKLGELSPEEREKLVNTIRKKYDKARTEANELLQLSKASTSSEIGGQIPIDIDKEVDDFGNILKKTGFGGLSKDLPFDVSISDVSMPDISIPDNVSEMLQNISIPKPNFRRGNFSFVWIIGGIIVILILAVLFLGGIAQGTVIKLDCVSNCEGYELTRSGNVVSVMITEPGKYSFAKSGNSQNKIMVSVKSAGVTLDGKGVAILTIEGKSDLDLKNININVNSNIDFSLSSNPNTFIGLAAISECRNIENSSIVVNDAYFTSGIGSLYGKIDDTTSITMTGYVDPLGSAMNVYSVFGIHSVYAGGIVSGGTFTIDGQSTAYGVYSVRAGGIVSGGTFNVNSEGRSMYYHTDGLTAGIGEVDGTISGGRFTVTGKLAVGVASVRAGGIVSGGRFSVTGDRAVGAETDGGIVSGGTFIVNGNDWRP